MNADNTLNINVLEAVTQDQVDKNVCVVIYLCSAITNRIGLEIKHCKCSKDCGKIKQ